MARLMAFMRRHTLWAVFAAVFVPLLVLLALQFVWLSRLQHATAVAHGAALGNYLEAVGRDVEYFYRAAAERTLNVPAVMFRSGRLDEVAQKWTRKPVEGARGLFLVDFTREVYGNFLMLDPVSGELRTPPASDEALAIIVACTPWQMLSFRNSPANESTGPLVDERDPDTRLLLNPILDSQSHVVGVAGMILDEEYLARRLLPAAVRRALPEFLPGTPTAELSLTARNGRGDVLLATGEAGEGSPRPDAARATLRFVFMDVTLELQPGGSNPEQWARASFVANMTLAVLLAGVLLGGIALALRTANRAMTLSEMKGDFVSNVSHELRTPLASIRVFAEFLRLGRASTPEKAREYGEYIEAESRRLSRLIDNILDFARIESGRKSYAFAQADLRDTVAATLQTFEIRLRHEGFVITFEEPEAPLPSLRFDPDAIGQALHNLLDNAVKYSGGKKELTVRLRRDGDDAVIEVRDHGIGIAPDEQQRIFERFHRVGTFLVHDVKGSGLGLSIVRHITEAHGGSVTVESEPGRGSVFALRLPLGLRPDAAPVAAPVVAGERYT